MMEFNRENIGVLQRYESFFNHKLDKDNKYTMVKINENGAIVTHNLYDIDEKDFKEKYTLVESTPLHPYNTIYKENS